MGNACSCFGKDKNNTSDKNIHSNNDSDRSISTRTSRKSAVRLAVQDVISHVREGDLKESSDETKKEHIQELLKATQNLKLNRKRFSEVYGLSKKIGQGGYSVVRKAIENSTQEVYAVKIMDLPYEGQVVDSNASSREDIFKEIEIVTEVEHPNIVYLKEFFVEENKVYLVMEYLRGGELLDAVLSMGMYTESDAKIIFRQILRALEYLHSHNVVHRDLKLENFLLVQHGDINRVKLADFGLAKLLKWGTMETVCGTPNYVAPEVISFKKDTQYSPKVDVWSAGVIMYILLSGEPPFRDDNETLIFRRIRKFKYSLDDRVWKGISEDAKDLIRHLLCPVTERYSATEALQHPWLQHLEIQENTDSNNSGRVNLSFRFNKNDVAQWKKQDNQMKEDKEKQYYKQRPNTVRQMRSPQLLDEKDIDDILNKNGKQTADQKLSKPNSLDIDRRQIYKQQDTDQNNTNENENMDSKGQNIAVPDVGLPPVDRRNNDHNNDNGNNNNNYDHGYRYNNNFQVQNESPSVLIDEELNRVESEYDNNNLQQPQQKENHTSQVQGQTQPPPDSNQIKTQDQANAIRQSNKRYNRIVLRMWKKALYKVLVARGLLDLFEGRIKQQRDKRNVFDQKQSQGIDQKQSQGLESNTSQDEKNGIQIDSTQDEKTGENGIKEW